MSGGGIYHWKLGDISLARITKKVFANVRVVKDEKGLFYDDKGISGNDDGSITVSEELCYYVENVRSKDKMWLPYTCMHLASRSRPFYGPADKVSPPTKPPSMAKKRKLKEDHTVPLNVKLPKREPDLNTTYDSTHTPLSQEKNENPFRAFVRRGKDALLDEFYFILLQDEERNEDVIDYVQNVNASTEDKYEMVIKGVVSEKEIEKYLHQCWRYNFLHKQTDVKDNTENSVSPVKAPITVHGNWCLVCGESEKLRACVSCPASFHINCRREWLVTLIHRKNPPKKEQKRATFVEKILSSTRTITAVHKQKESLDICPSCMWGPRVGYDDVVWHKLGSCPWWPARVLAPGTAPACLLSRARLPRQWPLRYYGTLNYAWGDIERMFLLLPSHAARAEGRDRLLQQAIDDACHDYISVYLT